MIYLNENAEIKFSTSGSEKMRLDSSGNLGVGTSTPDAKLQVFGTSAVPSVSGTFQGSIFSIEGSSTVSLGMGTSGSPGFYSWLQPHDAGGGVNYNLILNPLGGKVGIGTSTPDTKLEISENTDAAIRITSSDNFINIGEVLGSLDFVSKDYNFSAQPIKAQIQAVAVTSTGNSDLIINTTNDADKLERLRVRYNGTVELKGDSTTGNAQAYFLNNNTEFQMGSSSSAGVPKPMTFNTAGSERMRLDSSGNLGIGTVSSSAKLHIEDTSGNPQLVVGDAASVYSSIQSSNGLYINAGSGGGGSETIFRRGTSLTESMRLTSAGALLVGRTSSLTGIHTIQADSSLLVVVLY